MLKVCINDYTQCTWFDYFCYVFRFQQKYKDLDGEVIRKNGIILLRELTAEVKNFMDFKMNAVLVSAEIRKFFFSRFECNIYIIFSLTISLFAYLHVIS